MHLLSLDRPKIAGEVTGQLLRKAAGCSVNQSRGPQALLTVYFGRFDGLLRERATAATFAQQKVS